MLFEKTVYIDDFPINIRIVKVSEYPFHYHQDIEFVYVLKGEVRIKNVCHNYLLKEGDIFTNNGHEIHGLRATDSDNVVAVIQVSNRYFTRYFPDLPKACYMTYVKNDKTLKLDGLRKMLLNILMDYSKKSFDYKKNCIDQMMEIIKYMNTYFNLFAFEGDVVVDFKNSNPVIVERISRIINYVYAHHSNKITLEEIAEEEHLSTYYVSHLIKDYIGLNFQEFLGFARTEMSEIFLLESDKKISTVARDVGFSTTAYYNKFFVKWFGKSPEEYRRLYTSHILSSSRPARLENLVDYYAVDLIRKCMSRENDQESNNSLVNKLVYDVVLEPNMKIVGDVETKMEVFITMEDCVVMGQHLFNALEELHADKVILDFKSEHSESEIEIVKNQLEVMGYDVETVFDNGLSSSVSPKNDSIVAAMQIVKRYLDVKNRVVHCKLRDQGIDSKLLKGDSACITSALIPKPSYNIYKLLRNVNGKILLNENCYYVIKDDTAKKDVYVFIVINDSDKKQYAEMGESSVYETMDVIRSFKDELNVNFRVPVKSGKYIVTKYGISIENSIFAHVANLNFPDEFILPKPWMKMLSTEPKTQVGIEEVVEQLNVNSTIKGVGIQVIRVESI